MDDPAPTPTPKLRRAWLAGYRVGDVEVLLAELRFKVTHLRDETQRLTSRLGEVERHRAELEERSAAERPPDDRALPAVAPTALAATDGPVPPLRAILSAEYSPAVANDPGLRRARFRGYRRADVDAALAHDQLVRTRLELDLDSVTQRMNALELEIRELHARIDAGREREASLMQSLDEVRRQREQTERESRHRAEQVIREAEERAAALKTEGMRQVIELQAQVETLLGLRSGLTHTMQRLSEDLAAAMVRLAAAPATAIDYKPEDQLSRWALPES
jgi:DivIVA protein